MDGNASIIIVLVDNLNDDHHINTNVSIILYAAFVFPQSSDDEYVVVVFTSGGVRGGNLCSHY